MQIDLETLKTFIPIVVEIGDKVVAAAGNPFLKLAWALLRAFLVSEQGAQALHAAQK